MRDDRPARQRGTTSLRRRAIGVAVMVTVAATAGCGAPETGSSPVSSAMVGGRSAAGSAAPDSAPTGPGMHGSGAVTTSAPAPGPAPTGTPAPGAPAAPAIPTPVPANALRVVTIGDSEAKNAHCPRCKAYGYVAGEQLAALQRRPLNSVRFALGSYASGDLVTQLGVPEVRTAVSAADLLLVQLGANDFSQAAANVAACRDTVDACYGPTLAGVRDNLREGIRGAMRLQRKERARIVVVGYPNVLTVAARGRAKGADYMLGEQRLTEALNAVIREAAESSGALYVDTYPAVIGSGRDGASDLNLTADGNHLSAAGHAAVARAMLTRLGPEAATL